MTLDHQLAYRPNQAARALGMSRDTIDRLVERGELKSVKIGSGRYIPASELEALIARKLQEQAPVD